MKKVRPKFLKEIAANCRPKFSKRILLKRVDIKKAGKGQTEILEKDFAEKSRYKERV